MTEQPPEYVTDALEVIGSQPSVEIEHPRKIVTRKVRGEFFEETTTPAWVKFSTAFKDELSEIDGNALKVWIYIALSVDYKGEAFPAIQTIAQNIGLSHTTVIQHIKALEKIGLLAVRRKERRWNIYEITDDYVKIGKGEPVQKLESSRTTTKEIVPITKENDATTKASLTLTRSNKKKQDIKPPSRSKLIQDAMLLHFGLTVSPSWKAHLAWLKWAVEVVDMTPETIKYAAETWETDEDLNWKGKRMKPALSVLQTEWARIMDGYDPNQNPSATESEFDWTGLNG